jgi:hypothetical protein
MIYRIGHLPLGGTGHRTSEVVHVEPTTSWEVYYNHRQLYFCSFLYSSWTVTIVTRFHFKSGSIYSRLMV